MGKRVILLEAFGPLESDDLVAGGSGGGDDLSAAEDDAEPEAADLAHHDLGLELELVHAQGERQRPWSLEAHERLYRALMTQTPPRRALRRSTYTMRSRRKRGVEN